MPPIYISYRPQDADIVESIIRRARQTYGLYSTIVHPEKSFREDMRLDQHIDNLIHSASTVLIVIGQDWAGLDEYGRYKLSSADMPIHAEVMRALASQRQVIAVLVNDATLPEPALVPDEMQGLYDIPCVTVRASHFNQDISQLIHPPSFFSILKYILSLDWVRRYTSNEFNFYQG